jgi:hypothetical protein
MKPTAKGDGSPRQDADLLAKITAAVKAANTAEASVVTAQAELVSRSKQVGLLLLEAKKLHPAVKDLEAFLKRVDGLKLARAYDCMRIAGGRTTDEEIREATRKRVKEHRAKKKLPGPTTTPKPQPEPLKLSVTSTCVTETASAEISIDERKAQHADLDHVEEDEDAFADWLNAGQEAHKMSAHCLAEFIIACRTWLPKLTNQSHRDKARRLVNKMTEPLRAEVA